MEKKGRTTEEPPAKAPRVRMLMRFGAVDTDAEPSERDARRRGAEASGRSTAAPRPRDAG